MDLEALQRRVLKDLDEYVYSLPQSAVGTPLEPSYVQGHLDELRRSLVSPYLADIRMSQPFDKIGSNEHEIHVCAIVADPKDGNLLFYDPQTGDFGVAYYRDKDLYDMGIPGDAVGSFIAR